jgi:putative FmdB family regulatory protein
MPFYEYECKQCGHQLEAMQKVNDAPLKKCPSCGKSALQRLMSAPVFRLKGSGWYETDFKSDDEGKRNLADKPEDAKPADAKAADDKKDTKDAAPVEAAATKEDKPAENAKPRPAATKPAATKPAATKPAATKPAAPKPAASKPAVPTASRSRSPLEKKIVKKRPAAAKSPAKRVAGKR